MASPPQNAVQSVRERQPRRASASPTLRHRRRDARSQSARQRRRSASPRIRAHRQVRGEGAAAAAPPPGVFVEESENLLLCGKHLAGNLIFAALEDCEDDRIFEVDSCHIGSECSDDDDSCSESCCSEASSDQEAACLPTPACYEEASASRIALPTKSTPLCFFVAETGELVSAQHLVDTDAEGSTAPLPLAELATNAVDEAPLPVAATVVAKVSVADQMLKIMKLLEGEVAAQKTAVTNTTSELDNPNEAPCAEDWDSEDEVVVEDDEDDMEAMHARDAMHTVEIATRLARRAVERGLAEGLPGHDKVNVPPAPPQLRNVEERLAEEPMLERIRGGLVGALADGRLQEVFAAQEASREEDEAVLRARAELIEASKNGRLEVVVAEVAEEGAIQCGIARLSELILQTRSRAAQLRELSHGNTAAELSHATPAPEAEVNSDKSPAPSNPGFAEAFEENALGHVFAELAVVLDARSARWFMQEVFSTISELGVGVEAPSVEVTIETVETQIELAPCEAVLDLGKDLSEKTPASIPHRQAPEVLDLTEDQEIEDLSPSVAALATAGRTPHASRRIDDAGQGKKLNVSVLAGPPASSLRKHRHAMRHGGREALVSFALDASDLLDAASAKEAPRESSITRGYQALGVEFHNLDSGEEAEASAPTSRPTSRGHSLHESKPSRSKSDRKASARGGDHGSHSRPSSKSDRRASARGSGNAGTRALSAMELDMGMSPSAPVAAPCSPPTPSQSQQRSASTGSLRVSKSRHGQGFLPIIASKSAGTLPALAPSHLGNSEPFAWSVGQTRARRGLASVF